MRGPRVPEYETAAPQAIATPLAAREAEAGREIHQAIVSSFQVYTEPRLVGYVNRIGRSIARRAERQDLAYRFTVLYDDRVYANAAPGGFVYLTTGFLDFLQNEAELAAVLAHEVGELQYRDPRFSNSRRALDALAGTGAVAAPFFGHMGVLAAFSLVLLSAAFGPKTATDTARIEAADQKALHYLIEAGHDPQGFLDLVARLLKGGEEWAPYLYDYLASRPVTEERYQAALAEFEKLPLASRSFSVHRERYLDLTKGVREIYR